MDKAQLMLDTIFRDVDEKSITNNVLPVNKLNSKASNILNYKDNPSVFAISIAEDLYLDVLRDISLGISIEETIDNYLNDPCINEAVKIPTGSMVVFGRVIKDGAMIGKVKDGKYIPLDKSDDVTEKDIADAPASVRNIFKRLKKEVSDVATSLAVSKVAVAEAIAEPTVSGMMKKFGYSIKKLGEATIGTLNTTNKVLAQAFTELDKSGKLDGLKKGTEKVDKFLDDNPIIKKMAGPLVAGALVYQWKNMSFSGDLNDDFDVTTIASAALGTYSIQSLIASPNGLKACTQLALGLATGGALTFPWAMGMKFAAVYTGAKKLGQSDLAKKALTHLNSFGDKVKTVVKDAVA